MTHDIWQKIAIAIAGMYYKKISDLERIAPEMQALNESIKANYPLIIVIGFGLTFGFGLIGGHIIGAISALSGPSRTGDLAWALTGILIGLLVLWLTVKVSSRIAKQMSGKHKADDASDGSNDQSQDEA